MKLTRCWVLILILLAFGCKKKEISYEGGDFQTLMGAKKSVWKFVETPEDFQNMLKFETLYQEALTLQVAEDAEEKIPKVIHFIWLGPSPFPSESIENINSWASHHPDFVIKFWTDRRRSLPHPKMKLQLVSDFSFSLLKRNYEETTNYAEKSDLLRYEILSKEGGLYVDHDMQCFKSVREFHDRYHLYCGVEPPHQPVLSSSVTVNNNIIGASPQHPVLLKAMELVKARWDEIGAAYPEEDKESTIYRVAHRSWSSFHDAVMTDAGRGERRDVVFPAAYFNRIEGDFGLYAHHLYASTWFEDETKFEKNVRRKLVAITKKNNQILLLNGVILAGNLLLFLGLFLQLRSLRKRSDVK